MENKAINERNRKSQNQKEVTETSITEHPNPQEQKFRSLLLPYKGSEGTAIV